MGPRGPGTGWRVSGDNTGGGREPVPGDPDDRPEDAAPAVKAGDDWLVGAWSAERWKAAGPQAAVPGRDAPGGNAGAGA